MIIKSFDVQPLTPFYMMIKYQQCLGRKAGQQFHPETVSIPNTKNCK